MKSKVYEVKVYDAWGDIRTIMQAETLEELEELIKGKLVSLRFEDDVIEVYEEE